jgi:hypothetical protein
MKRYNCIPAGDHLAPVASTEVTPTDFAAQKISLEEALSATITYFVQGVHGSCAEKITFIMQSYDSLRDSWDTEPLITKEIMMNGLNAIQETDDLPVGPEAIRLYSVTNAAAGGSGRDAYVNASVYVNRF